VNAAVEEILRLAYQMHPLQLAYHEVGHGLVAHAVGRQVTRISIDRHGGLMTSEGPASPEALLLVSLAGDRAERLTPGCVENLSEIDVGSKDKADVNFALDVIGSDTLHRDFVLADATCQVDALLREQQEQLDRLARLLLRRHALDGYELRRLLE
jgi:hypothetical protein